eukprot:gene6042-6744_t
MMNESVKVCLTFWPLEMRESYLHAVMIIIVILSPIMLFLNIFLIHALHKVQPVKSTTEKLIVCMSASDAIIGGIVFPMLAVMLKSDALQQNCVFLKAVQYFAFTFGYMSYFLLIIVALDRYLHLIKLNRYNEFMNENRLRAILGAIFVFSNSLAAITVLVQSFYLVVAMNSLNVLGLTSIFGMYCSVLRSILSHAKSLARVNVMPENNSTASNTMTETDKFYSGKSSDEADSRSPNNNDKHGVDRKLAHSDGPSTSDVTESTMHISRIDVSGRILEGDSVGNSGKKKKKRSKQHKQLASNKRDQAVTRTILVLLLTVFMLYNPYNVLTIMWTKSRFNNNNNTDPDEMLTFLTLISYVMLFCNGIANVLILASSNAKIRKYVARKLSAGLVNDDVMRLRHNRAK